MYFLAGFFFKSHPVYDQTQGSGAVFSFQSPNKRKLSGVKKISWSEPKLKEKN
jgi:hypothetical protein